jgi:uncharacterized protein involved in outer membrane biogenesis
MENRMNKTLKIMVIVIGILLSLFVVLSLFVKSYLTDDRVRRIVLENAEKILDREVRLGDIKVSLFRGIVVRDVEVKEKDSEQSFITATDFILRYQILPLFRKQLIIDELSLNDSLINLNKNADGSFNFSDLAKTDKDPDMDDKEKIYGLPFGLAIQKINIKNARVVYTEAAGKLKKADILLNAELGISGMSGDILSSTGQMGITVAEAWLRDREQALKNITAAFSYEAEADISSGRISLNSVSGEILSTPFSLQGVIAYSGDQDLSFDINIPEIVLANLRELTAQFIPDMKEADGKLSLLLRISKMPADNSPFVFDGNITMTRLSFTYKGLRPVMDGSLRLTPEVINFQNLQLRAGQNSADVSGSVRNYMKYPDIRVAVKSRSLLLDELFVIPPGSVKPDAAPVPSTPAQREPVPMDLKLRMNASLQIGKTSYKGIPVNDFRLEFGLQDNILRITDLSGSTLSGSFGLNSIIDLGKRGTVYSMDLNLAGVKLEEIVNAFAPMAKDKLFGTLDGKASISGAGTLPENIKRNLKGKGSFSVRDGVLRNAEISEGLLAFLGLQELREVPMQKAEGNFTVAGRTVNLTTLISSRDIIINQKGTIGMDEKLDLSVLAKVSDRLSPKLLTQSGISRFLSEEKGWTSIPLRIGGTLSEPSYALDTRAVGKKAGEIIQKRIEEELFKSLQKDKEDPSDAEQRKRTRPEDIIRDLLR